MFDEAHEALTVTLDGAAVAVSTTRIVIREVPDVSLPD